MKSYNKFRYQLGVLTLLASLVWILRNIFPLSLSPIEIILLTLICTSVLAFYNFADSNNKIIPLLAIISFFFSIYVFLGIHFKIEFAYTISFGIFLFSISIYFLIDSFLNDWIKTNLAAAFLFFLSSIIFFVLYNNNLGIEFFIDSQILNYGITFILIISLFLITLEIMRKPKKER